jgi:hypothetical protein
MDTFSLIKSSKDIINFLSPHQIQLRLYNTLPILKNALLNMGVGIGNALLSIGIG